MSSSPSFFFLSFFFFFCFKEIFLKGKITERGREIRNLPYINSLAKWPQQPGLRQTKTSSFLWVTQVDGVLGPFFIAVPSMLARSCIVHGAAETQTSIYAGRQHRRWWFHSLSQYHPHCFPFSLLDKVTFKEVFQRSKLWFI